MSRKPPTNKDIAALLNRIADLLDAKEENPFRIRSYRTAANSANRDTYCPWLAEANVPVHVPKALAGHSTIEVTDGYITGRTKAMKEEVRRIRLPRV